ncbi:MULTISPECIES: hypothetical protein [unclassified Nocardioides]|uniref:hypothetical protein n=1 Tax=unclassified Nocardioides TaxID=2615069 RepID=UPI0006FFD45B|nr:MULTISPECIES: hypothetical protein [unclassified Nocardioides]KRA32573.1 hypothetical protein ASD81_13610 [Nocardioides sp. Root614]KRA89226.1 hypothetical protein ASD84_13875 [Nocardioides sp. Root682]
MRISGSRWLLAGTAVVALLVAALVAGAVLHGGARAPRTPSPAAAVVAPEARTVSVARAVGSLAVLRDWDRSRAAAWAAGDPAALARLYVEGSRAGAADVAMLRAWRERGLRVEGMSMQVLAVELRSRTDRRLVLVVTDRLVGAKAVGWSRDGCCATSSTSGVRLPDDQATTRTLVFRKVGGRWVLGSVQESVQESPVASTAATSGSSN